MPDSLIKRKQKILEPRFSQYDGRLSTLEEWGKTIQKPRERIRQIKAKAPRNLFHPKPPIERIPRIFGRRNVEFLL